jgi:HAD superfamily hydrolase (TIGR01484 family)
VRSTDLTVWMRQLDCIGEAEARRLRGLLFDLDDTLLDHGRLTEAAYSALFRLRESGLALVAVTGRPSGWGELLARQWPIEGMVTENGAIALYRENSRVERLDSVSEQERARRRARLAEIVAELKRRFPELEPADDVAARVSDFTFDIGERRTVARERVLDLAREIRNLGARSVSSSVHLHVSLDPDDKASGAVRLLRRRLGEDPTRARACWAFIGDSDNDAACFAAFHTTIAVANFQGRPTASPRYVTAAARGAGFAEAARILCQRRGAGGGIGARPAVR